LADHLQINSSEYENRWRWVIRLAPPTGLVPNFDCRSAGLFLSGLLPEAIISLLRVGCWHLPFKQCVAAFL
jgi:hypothetical protein